MSEMLPPPAPPIDPGPPVEPGPPPLPWEAPNAGLGSIAGNLKMFVLSPIEAFKRMSLSVDLVRPLAYYVAVVLIGAVFNTIWQMVFWADTVGKLRQLLPAQTLEILEPFLQRPALWLTLWLAAVPLILLILLVVWSALVHVSLVLLGGAGGGFGATLRVCCYGRTSDLAVMIPYIGGLVAFVWRRILEMIGLATAHKTEPWKAVVAELLPLAFCCCCLAAGGAFLSSMLAQALQNMR